MEEINSGIIEQQPEPITQPADNGEQGTEKMFTQEEVNEIVRARLERERKKNEPKKPTEAELRERDLKARENRLECREYLARYGYPSELLDILDTSDTQKFKTTADDIHLLIYNKIRAERMQIEAPMASKEPTSVTVNSGFAKKAHVPKQFPPLWQEKDG